MFVGTLLLAALTFVPFVLACGNALPGGLIQALNNSGLDQFINQTGFLNCTPNGQSVLRQLSRGNNTIFAPTDKAWASINTSLINNATSLANLLAYHVVSGNSVNQTQAYPNVSIGRTLLNDSNLVTLEGNQSQVLVWSKYGNGTFFVQNQGTNITVVNTTTYNTTTILAIGSVLIPPPNISTIMTNASYNLTSAAGILQSATLPNGTSLLDILSSAHGVTVFAPNNAAIQAAQGSLLGLSGNVTAIKNLLFNHVINGTSVYTTEMSNKSTYASVAGQKCAFLTNSTGLFVSVGGSNAVEIVEPNLLTSNGVIQVVNGVMLDTNGSPVLNPTVVSSVYASATSVIGHSLSSITQTFSPSTTTAVHTSAAKDRFNNWQVGMLAGMVVGLMQIV